MQKVADAIREVYGDEVDVQVKDGQLEVRLK